MAEGAAVVERWGYEMGLAGLMASIKIAYKKRNSRNSHTSLLTPSRAPNWVRAPFGFARAGPSLPSLVQPLH